MSPTEIIKEFGAVDLEIMKHYFRLYEKPEVMPEYNRFNIPVWVMEKDG